METATLIVMLALLEYIVFTGRVGVLRGKYGIEAPATVGHPVWERLFRIQQNTLEQLIIFIPGTYAFAAYVSPKWVWIPGALFIIARLLYSLGYAGDPNKRVIGMSLTLASNATLVIGTLIALVMDML